jgi:hypothetical protein
MDGGMVAIRGEGWKAIKIGSIGQIERRWTADGQEIRLTGLRYTGVLGDVNTFQSAFWALATRCNVMYAGQTVVTADGAGWIWRVARHLFPCSTQIVDWYHASQPLAQAVSAQHPTDPQSAAHPVLSTAARRFVSGQHRADYCRLETHWGRQASWLLSRPQAPDAVSGVLGNGLSPWLWQRRKWG